MISETKHAFILTAKSHKIVRSILEKAPWLKEITGKALSYSEWCNMVKEHAETILKDNGDKVDDSTKWKNIAAERVLDYIKNMTLEFKDPHNNNAIVLNDSFKPLWTAIREGRSTGNEYYFKDVLFLFRQLSGDFTPQNVPFVQLQKWMERHPTGLDEEIVEIRKRNKARIISHIVDMIDNGDYKQKEFKFSDGISKEDKIEIVNEWWDSSNFHLRFAIRDPETLNRMLDHSLSGSTMDVLRKANEEGIPFFINPYYLSLLFTEETTDHIGADLAIREYILYNKDIIEEYGDIEAWEKEDIVVPGKPNAAGWILPYHNNLHRRYPEVAIMIPDTLGRTCGGLCVSCQRMYEFQSGGLNFNLDRTIEYDKWGEKLKVIMKYFEEDKQLRDILITGGDALMSSNRAIKQMFEAIIDMVERKRESNKSRPDGEKYAEIKRIRLGTRLPAYLPLRVTEYLVNLLTDFRAKAQNLGVQQFVIQTHFETSMEVTPESAKAVKMLSDAGWLVTNQHVFTVASSRRGHKAKLRATLAKIGIMPYYTFSVKGFLENRHNFATNARLMQEKHEEKEFGMPGTGISKKIMDKASRGVLTAVEIDMILKEHNIPFIASDRSMMNLPGIGKSMTYRNIGLTNDGRRILEFDYDHSRSHSPVIDKMDKVIIVESKPLGAYLDQVENLGEDPLEYESIFAYSKAESEKLFPIFEYPPYDFEVTEELNHYAEIE